MLGDEFELFFNLLDHCTATGVDADVIKGEPEIRDVGLHLHLQDFAAHKVDEENQLLREWQNERAEGGDVLLESTACLSHQLPCELDSLHTPMLVELLRCTQTTPAVNNTI